MSLTDVLSTGQFPPLSLQIIPLDRTPYADGSYGFRIDRFLSYSFQSSVVQPVQSFSFTFVYDEDIAFREYVTEGDIVQIQIGEGAAETLLATGIIETVDVDVDAHNEIVTVHGRNLLGLLDDQHLYRINGDTSSGKMTPAQVMDRMKLDTRFQKVRFQNIDLNAHFFATEVGESKLQAITRYLEPRNALIWQDPDGTVVLGKPNMLPLSTRDLSAEAAGLAMVVNKKRGVANCLSMRDRKSTRLNSSH